MVPMFECHGVLGGVQATRVDRIATSFLRMTTSYQGVVLIVTLGAEVCDPASA